MMHIGGKIKTHFLESKTSKWPASTDVAELKTAKSMGEIVVPGIQ